MRSKFDALPKSGHWVNKARRKHLDRHGLTPEIIIATLESPTDTEIQNWRRDQFQAFFRFYSAETEEARNSDNSEWGVWFRVVLDTKDELYTAFRDNRTEINGGREICPTPNTTRNLSR